MAETVHQIGPPLRTVTIHKAYAVYKDYDGNAPDGPVYAVCATKELADQVCRILQAANDINRDCDTDNCDNDSNDDNSASDQPVLTEDETAIVHEISNSASWPYVDGSEWASCWCVQETEDEQSKIATTLTAVIAKIG